jgi:hypothetical protein
MGIYNPTQVDWTRPGAIGLNTPNSIAATSITATGNFNAGGTSNSVGANTNSFTFFGFNGSATANKQMVWQTAGLSRWNLYSNGAGGEPGSNAGASLTLSYYTDAGGYLGDTFTANRAGVLSISAATSFTKPVKLASFTVLTAPSASANSAGMIYISNESGGATPAFSDGVSWRRVHDRAIIS